MRGLTWIGAGLILSMLFGAGRAEPELRLPKGQFYLLRSKTAPQYHLLSPQINWGPVPIGVQPPAERKFHL